MDSIHKRTSPKTPLLSVRETASLSYEITPIPPKEIFPSHISSIFHEKPKKKLFWKKPLLIFSLLFLCVLFSFVFLFLYKSISIGRTIQLDNQPPVSLLTELKHFASTIISDDTSSLDGEKDGRINILLLGRAGEHYPGRNLTDTVMLLSIDTVDKKVALLSLPRDLYVPIPETSFFTKINSLYQYGLSNDVGIETLRASAELITNQQIHYSLILDFDGFEKVVDALGGISIDVVRDFYDPRYPGKNYSYETFEIKKGWQTLDGATALKYVRERHNDPEGDFGRAKRQQQVIQAIKDKAFSMGTVFNFFAVRDLLDALGESVQTDMSLGEMETFLRLVRTLDTKNVTSVVIDAWKKDSLLRVSHIQVGPTAMFILVPRIGNWNEVREVSEDIFHLDTMRARQDMIKEEGSSVTILSLPKDRAIAEKMKNLIEAMGFQKISIDTSGVLKNRDKESTIRDTTEMKRPYSLDELLHKFPLKKEGFSESLSERGEETSDFIITLGEDIVEALSFDEENIQAIPDDTVFSEILPPQEKTKKKKE